MLNVETDAQKQMALEDRASNPYVQDICRLFIQWRTHNYEEEDVKGMFERLQKEVDKYNKQCVGGKALLQWYEACNIDGSACEDSESESIPKPKRKKRDVSDKPL